MIDKICNSTIYKHRMKLLLAVSMLALYLILLLTRSLDNDMFFEIMSGRDILNGNFHTISHLGNFPTIIQQWLYAVCLAIADKFGYTGYIVFMLIQNLILYVVSFKLLYLRTEDKVKSLLIPAMSILICNEYMINIRPQIITVMLLAFELLLVELYQRKKQFRYLLYIIPVLILAANMHQAIFLYHIFVLIPYLIKKESKWIIDAKLFMMLPIYTICSILTPYGLDGSLYIVRTFQSNVYKLIAINELQHLSLTSHAGIKLLILTGITIFLIYKHKIDQYSLFYMISIFILAMINARHISILYIGIIYLFSCIDVSKLNKDFWYSIAYIIVGTITVLYALVPASNAQDFGNIENVIQDKDAKIYNSAMDLGGWLEYNGYTNLRLDSRCEAFTKEISGVDGVIEEYTMVSKGYNAKSDTDYQIAEDEDIYHIINQYDYVIATKTQYVNRLIADNDNWKLIYDNKYNVYEKVNE